MPTCSERRPLHGHSTLLTGGPHASDASGRPHQLCTASGLPHVLCRCSALQDWCQNLMGSEMRGFARPGVRGSYKGRYWHALLRLPVCRMTPSTRISFNVASASLEDVVVKDREVAITIPTRSGRPKFRKTMADIVSAPQCKSGTAASTKPAKPMSHREPK